LQIDRRGALHLTYCTNIHAANGWPAVFENLRRYAPALKRRLSPGAPFGIGLRLAATEARQLLTGSALDDFRAFLDHEGLYVAILNGFPYGPFHRSVVKADVYAPDWRTDERVAYTLDLFEIVRQLVPAGVDAGVSTVPLSYKAWLRPDDLHGWSTITSNLVRVARRLVEIRRDYGVTAHIDIEPEPDCSIETTNETIAFFHTWLFDRGAHELGRATGLSVADARRAVAEHVRVCLDCCHVSVEYEDHASAIRRLREAGIQIGRIQLSSAIRVAVPAEPEARQDLGTRLSPFADATYLHQVVSRSDGMLRHFADLDEALACHGACGDEWRIHFHVPLFAREYDGLESSQDDVATVIRLARDEAVTSHLEIETYTWDVLPAALKLDLADSIAREYDWVLDTFRSDTR
jgi:sugar phosphate isomerase/epimerase